MKFVYNSCIIAVVKMVESKKYDPDLYKNHPYYEQIKSCNSLDELKTLLFADFNLEIAKTAKNPVFADGVGDLMLVGEAPGKNEDEEGRPFCGRSGKVLDDYLAKINIFRGDNAYITNVVNWRPEENRTPYDNEVLYCLPYLEKHIALKNPKLIVALGTTAGRALLLQKMIKIDGLRKKLLVYKNFFSRKEIPMIVTFHPSYMLRRRDMKYEFQEEFEYIGRCAKELKIL